MDQKTTKLSERNKKELYNIQFSTSLNIYLPGLARDAAQILIEAAHQTCPYSKAIRGNVEVAINLI